MWDAILSARATWDSGLIFGCVRFFVYERNFIPFEGKIQVLRCDFPLVRRHKNYNVTASVARPRALDPRRMRICIKPSSTRFSEQPCCVLVMVNCWYKKALRSRIESMQQSSATPSLYLSFGELQHALNCTL